MEETYENVVINSFNVDCSFGHSTYGLAETKTEKVMRNDRVVINKPVVEFDINPFVDRQRILRNDRINYTVVKNSKKIVKQERIMRNDRVSFYKPAK